MLPLVDIGSIAVIIGGSIMVISDNYRETPFRHDYVFDEVKLSPFAMLIKTAAGDTDVNVRIEFQISAKGVQRTEDANYETMLFSKILQSACRQFDSFFSSQRLCSMMSQSSLGMVKVICCQSQPLGKISLC